MTSSLPAEPPPPPRLFSIWAVGIGAFVGGPLGGGVLIGLNYRRLGDRAAATKAFAAGAVITVLLCWIFFGAPAEITDRIPKALVPAVCGPLAAYLWVRLQGDAIRRAIESGAGGATAGETVAWTAGALAVSLGVLVPFILVRAPLGFHGQKHAFGPHEAYRIYFAGRIGTDERASLERYLVRTGFFAGGAPRSAQLTKRGGTYVLSLGIRRSDWEKPELVKYLNLVRGDLEEFVVKSRVRVVMVDEDRYRIYRREIPSSSKP